MKKRLAIKIVKAQSRFSESSGHVDRARKRLKNVDGFIFLPRYMFYWQSIP